MISSNIEYDDRGDAPEGVDIFYMVVKRIELDDTIFKHQFDSTLPIRIPPKGLRDALRQLSMELAPSGADCQVVKRGNLPFLLVWSTHLGGIVAITQNTKALQTSCKQILEFFENEYSQVVEDGGDLTGHGPTVQHIKNVLRPVLLRKQSSPPPPEQILTYEAANYYFLTTEDQISYFSSVHVTSNGLQRLLDRETIANEKITAIMIRLKDNFISLTELSEEFKISIKSLSRVLRHLNLFNLVSIYFTPV
jgi:hypothetical protein